VDRERGVCEESIFSELTGNGLGMCLALGGSMHNMGAFHEGVEAVGGEHAERVITDFSQTTYQRYVNLKSR
jgi:hypothetical protein